MNYGLVYCRYCSSRSTRSYNGIPNGDGRLPSHNNKCINCEYTNYLTLICEIDATHTCKKFTVYTFGNKRYASNESMLAKPEDEIRQVLSQNNFSVAKTTNSHIIYKSVDGATVIFNIRSFRKTQEMLVYAPEKHIIFKLLDTANKNIKKAKKLASPPKPVITSQKDFLGETIVVGDYVAFSSMHDTSLKVGEIVKVNEKSVTLKTNGGKLVKGKSIDQIIKIPENKAMLYILEN